MTFYNDNDARIVRWLRGLIASNLIPSGHVDGRSIAEISPSELHGFVQHHFFCGIAGWPEALRLAGWPITEPVWSASLPCQPWANCGRGLGEEDARHLAPSFLALTQVCAPPIIFGEQVASADAMRWLDALFFHLEGQGYTCAAADLCSAGVGTIHVRQRLFWSAHSDSFRVPRLEPPPHSGSNGQGRACGAEDLQSIVQRPFLPSSRWPQPLLCPLDDGLSKRVAGCHAAGNAIVPELAAQFILAMLEAIAEQETASTHDTKA